MANINTDCVVQFFGIPGSGKSTIISELLKVCKRNCRTALVIGDNLVNKNDFDAMSRSCSTVQMSILDKIQEEYKIDPQMYDYVFVHTPLDMIQIFNVMKYIRCELTDYEFNYLSNKVKKLQQLIPLTRANVALQVDPEVAEANVVSRKRLSEKLSSRELKELTCLVENFVHKREMYILHNPSLRNARDVAEDIFQYLEEGLL